MFRVVSHMIPVVPLSSVGGVDRVAVFFLLTDERPFLIELQFAGLSNFTVRGLYWEKATSVSWS